MNARAAQPLFVDTSAWYAIFDEDDAAHERAWEVFDAIRDERLAYRPLYTTSHVVGELATLLLARADHGTATRALAQVRDSGNVYIIHSDPVSMRDAIDEFARYDDQLISLVDHLTVVLANERDADHVFTFDTDFRTLGCTVVPDDVHIPEGD